MPVQYKEQVFGSKWLASKRTALLADDPGYGKSNQAICAADLIGAKTILVVCPGIARAKWCEDFTLWSKVPRLVEPVMSTKAIPMADVLVVSYSLIRRLPVLRYLLTRIWDVVIFDEARALKNPNASQTRASYGSKTDGRQGLASRGKHVWLLDGTIMPNHAGELWSHANALFKDVDGYCTTYNRWVDKYCLRKSHSDAIVGTKPETLKTLSEAFKPYSLRRKIDKSKLPPLRVNRYPILPEKIPARSKEIVEIEYVLKGAIAKLSANPTEDQLEALKAVSETHIATLRKWTGLVLAPHVVEFIKNEIEKGLKKYIIFANHQEVIELFLKELPNTVGLYGPVKEGNKPGQRDYNIRQWQGKIPGEDAQGLIANYTIASSALNLVQGARVFMPEFPWIPSEIDQAIFRTWRNGQTEPVEATLFSLAGSVHDQITRALVRKLKITTAFNDAITAN